MANILLVHVRNAINTGDAIFENIDAMASRRWMENINASGLASADIPVAEDIISLVVAGLAAIDRFYQEFIFL